MGPDSILVLWSGQSSSNLGVRVLAEGSRTLLQSAFGVTPRIAYRDFEPNASEAGFNKATVLKDVMRFRRGEVARALDQARLVYDTGAGDSFTDIYGIKRHALMMYVRGEALRRGIPIVFGPQTVGPFNTPLARRSSAWVLKRAALTIARDSVSARAARDLGARNLIRATDVVFALPRPERRDQRDVILNVSGLLWSGSGHVDGHSYRALIRGLVGALQSAGREVALLAHVLDSPNVDNDVPAILALQESLAKRIEVIIPNSLDDARVNLASARLVLGSRMHACLNALSVGTPAVPMAYSRKFAPLMDDLGWRHTVDLRCEGDLLGEVLAPVDALGEDGSATHGDLVRLNSSAEALLHSAVVSLREVAS